MFPNGGKTDDVLTKTDDELTVSDQNTAWLPALQATMFSYATVFSYPVTIAVNDTFLFEVPAAQLPTKPFDFIVSSGAIGPGVFFASNKGITGAPAQGIWLFNLWGDLGSGLDYQEVARINIGPGNGNPFAVPNTIRFASANGLTDASDHIFRYDPAIDTGIKFSITCSAVPENGLAASFIVGIQGQIILLNVDGSGFVKAA